MFLRHELFTRGTQKLLEPESGPAYRALSTSEVVPKDYPQSPAERYFATRAQMLYDVNAQQLYRRQISSASHETMVISAYNQPPLSTRATNPSNHSLGFDISPDIIVSPPSDSSSKLNGTKGNDSLVQFGPISEQDSPLSFQPTSTSTQSTGDYPLEVSSIGNSSTFCIQLSHSQYMEAWRQNQANKIQKQHRHCYVYNSPPRSPLADRVASAVILTPQILSTTMKQKSSQTSNSGIRQRSPTTSPFQFPVSQEQMDATASPTITETQLKPTNRKWEGKYRKEEISIVPKRTDLNEDILEVPDTDQSFKLSTKSAHQELHQSSSDSTKA